MTATPPPEETSGSKPVSGEASPQESATPGPGPRGAAPAGAEQQPASVAARNGAGEGYEAIAYEKFGAGPGASRRKNRRWIVASLVTGLVAGAVPLTFETVRDYVAIPWTVAKENDSQKKVDASQPPFTVSVQPERGEPESWTMVLDRELTADETQKMQDSSSPFAYLRDLGGHPLEYASSLVNAPQRYLEQQTASGRLENVDTFKLNFLSTRAYPVMIDDWKVVDLACVQSTRKTVVSRPSQGGAAYEGISLHLPPRADEPVLTDDTEGQGMPYFDSRYIEVGGGQSSGALRVEAIAPPGQSCEWGIEVHYADAHHQDEYVQLTDGDGSPLRIHTESAPENPRQKWVFGSVPWTPCHLNPQGDQCDLV